MRVFPVFAFLGIAGLAFAAFAATATVYQHGRKFSMNSVVVRKGEPLAFVNDDTVPHNVVSRSKGNEFDLGSQPPGASTEVFFTEPGEVEVICAIHPRMAMKVKVTE